MKSKALIAMAVAGAFFSTGAIADQSMHSTHSKSVNMGIPAYEVTGPSSANESSFGMSTLTSLDTRTGGYKGWGPMANPYTASSADESQPLAQIEEERDHKQQLAEVKSARDEVWVANAPLRSEYDNIGATRSEGGGFLRFFSRDK
jgi:hypothetical protein